MKNVKVKRKELLKVLEENRAKHIEEHTELLSRRLKEQYEAMTKALEWLNKHPGQQRDFQLSFPVPQSHESDYNRAIRMVELEVRDEIELEQMEFDQLVMDNWSWQRDFLRTKTLYGMAE